MRPCLAPFHAGVLLLVAGCLIPRPLAGGTEVLAPRSWTGQWEFTITYRDHDTGRIVAVDRIADDICTNEPLGLALFPSLPGCRSTVTSEGVALQCASDFNAAACAAHGALQLDLRRRGETLSGTGEWSATLSGDCGLVLKNDGEAVEITAVRRSLMPGGGCASPSGLAPTLVTHPAALLVSATPFATLAVAKLDLEEDEFAVSGTFTLAAHSNGIDPAREAVRLQVGTFTTVLPAGSLRLRPAKGKKPAAFTSEGTAGRARLELEISPLAGGGFAFKAEGERTRVAARRSPMPVALAIGNDGGTVAATAPRDRDGDREHGDDDDREAHHDRE